jgi:hypothetical protein
MLTRRDILIGAMAAGALTRTRIGFAKAAQPATPVNFDVPAGACDCHTHIHGDPIKFPFFAGPDYTDVVPLAKALIAANADRIIWGTDWPHPNSVGDSTTHVTPLFQIDDGRLLNQLPVWAPDAAIRKKILVDNPAKLYAF